MLMDIAYKSGFAVWIFEGRVRSTTRRDAGCDMNPRVSSAAYLARQSIESNEYGAR